MPAADNQPVQPVVGVVVVTFAAEKFIANCLESLALSAYPALKVVVVDNGSPDDTIGAVTDWASGTRPFQTCTGWAFPDGVVSPKPIALDRRGPDGADSPATAAFTLIETGENLGFAGGVNVGLRALIAAGDVNYFWVLNPDTVLEPETLRAFVEKAQDVGRFSVIGGRVVYQEDPELVQSDGGRIHKLGCTAISVNMRRSTETPMPAAESLDFVTGASMFASRAFLERAGLMDEGWFLYYEEIDWQLRRGDLPLVLAPRAVVRHHAGASIGSGSGRAVASPFAVYFTYRNLLRFAARWFPLRLPFAYLIVYYKMARHFRGAPAQLLAAFCGIHGMGPPKSIRNRLSEADWARIGAKR